jgi:AsmA protein
MPGLGVSLKITAAKARVGGAPLTRFVAAVVNNGGNVRVDPFEFDAFGGHLSGSLDAGIAQTLRVNVQANVANLDVEQLAAFGGSAGAITGQLSGSVRLTSRGADLDSALAAATGGGDARIGPGTLRGLQIVRTVVLFFGRPASDAPASAGERFDDISATFRLANRMVRSEDLRMRSPDVDLLARGSLDLPNKALDARAELVLSESLSAQAGTDLNRYTRRGNRIVLPARIGGQLGQPRVSIDAGAAIKRGIENELQRRLERLFKP